MFRGGTHGSLGRFSDENEEESWKTHLIDTRAPHLRTESVHQDLVRHDKGQTLSYKPWHSTPLTEIQYPLETPFIPYLFVLVHK